MAAEDDIALGEGFTCRFFLPTQSLWRIKIIISSFHRTNVCHTKHIVLIYITNTSFFLSFGQFGIFEISTSFLVYDPNTRDILHLKMRQT